LLWGIRFVHCNNYAANIIDVNEAIRLRTLRPEWAGVFFCARRQGDVHGAGHHEPSRPPNRPAPDWRAAPGSREPPQNQLSSSRRLRTRSVRNADTTLQQPADERRNASGAQSLWRCRVFHIIRLACSGYNPRSAPEHSAVYWRHLDRG